MVTGIPVTRSLSEEGFPAREPSSTFTFYTTSAAWRACARTGFLHLTSSGVFPSPGFPAQENQDLTPNRLVSLQRRQWYPYLARSQGGML